MTHCLDSCGIVTCDFIIQDISIQDISSLKVLNIYQADKYCLFHLFVFLIVSWQYFRVWEINTGNIL